MLERITLRATFQIIIAVVSAFVGLFLSPSLERILSPLLDTPTRLILTGLVLISVLLVIAITMIGVFAQRREEDILTIRSKLSDINSRLGITVKFVHDPPKRGTGEVYKVAREIVENAQQEILVLQYVRTRDSPERQRGYDLETDAYRSERSKYRQALLDKAQQNKAGRFFYRRVMQFPEGKEVRLSEGRLGSYWFKHTQTILGMLADYPEAAYVKKAPLFIDQTIVIVDDRYVFWGIDSIDPDRQARYMEGALFFDDPHQEFVRYLKNFFHRVDAHGTMVRQLPEN